MRMTEERPVRVKRPATSSMSSEVDLICILHYSRCKDDEDNEIRTLSDSQFQTLRHACTTRQSATSLVLQLLLTLWRCVTNLQVS